MAISGGMGVLQTGLQNIQRTAENAPMPLDAIAAKRERERAAKLAEYEAESARMKAEAAGVAAEAQRATEARVSTGAAEAQAEMQRIIDNNPITLSPDQPGYLAQKYQIYSDMTLSTNPDVQEQGQKLAAAWHNEMEASVGGTTLGENYKFAAAQEKLGLARQAEVEADVAESGLNQKQQTASENDIQWARNVMPTLDPKGGYWPYNDWSPEQKEAQARALGKHLHDLRMRYAGNTEFTEFVLTNMAIEDFKASIALPANKTTHPTAPIGGRKARRDGVQGQEAPMPGQPVNPDVNPTGTGSVDYDVDISN